MRHRLLIKLFVIGALVLGLTIPNLMIREIVIERSHYRHEARQGIAASWTGAQTLLGPVLVVPYTERLQRTVWDADQQRQRPIEQVEERRLFVLPSDLEIAAEVRTEERRRGIYAIPVYESAIEIQGVFENRALLELARGAAVSVHWERAFLALPLSDLRGVVVQPSLDWNGRSHEFVSGAAIGAQGSGMRAEVGGLETAQPERFAFGFALRLHGMERLQFSPAGRNTRVRIASAWRHPSFLGRYLPNERTIDDQGFSAEWRVSAFSGDMARVSELCQRGDCDPFFDNTFGVGLVQPVDVYHQTERSVKYAILIIALTFVAFFLFEVMRAVPLHPMQYLLVGCSQTVFYLLLLSLSEHIAFGWAYLSASVANVALIGTYVSAVLQGRRRALMLTAALAALYGMLYAILCSEDNALLMGSLLLFAVLAGVMLLTRRLDWYRIAEGLAQSPAGPMRSGRPG